MHILNEGLFGKELCLMLYDFVKVRKYITLSCLNNSLANFSVSYLEEKDKPQIITMDEISNGKLKQTAAAMMTLCCILPLVLGPKVRKRWKVDKFSPYNSDITACHKPIHDRRYSSKLGAVDIHTPSRVQNGIPQLTANSKVSFLGTHTKAIN